jgi:predicted MFS family arabinose efflux permease
VPKSHPWGAKHLLLVLVPLAPNLGSALALLVLRFALSQMDVPARQAYLAALAGPQERSEAASITNAARTVARPFSAPLAGAATASATPGLPFFLAGGLKALYDVILLLSFRRTGLERSADAGRRGVAFPN